MSVSSASIPRSQYLHQSYPFPLRCLTLLFPLLCFLPFDPTKPSALLASTAMSLARRPVIAVPSSVTELWCEYAFDRENCWPCTSGRAERCEPPAKNKASSAWDFCPSTKTFSPTPVFVEDAECMNQRPLSGPFPTLVTGAFFFPACSSLRSAFRVVGMLNTSLVIPGGGWQKSSLAFT